MDQAADEGIEGQPLPPPHPLSRPAGWWAWPMIVAGLAMVIASVLRMGEAEASFDAGGANPPGGDSVGMVMLKFQAQVIVGASVLQTGGVDRDLTLLWESVAVPEERAALALVAGFVKSEALSTIAGEGEGAWQDLSPERGELMRRALTVGVTEAERAEMEPWLGWFARLAPGPEGEEPDGAVEIRQQAVVTMVIAGLLVLTGGVAWLFGVCLLVYYLVVKRKEAGFHAYCPQASAPGVLLEAFALYLGLMAAGEAMAPWHPAGQILGFCLALVVPLLWPRIRGVNWRETGMAVGWTKGRGFRREVGAGLVGYFVLLALASVGLTGTFLLSWIVEFGRDWLAGSDGDVSSVGPQEHPIVGFLVEGDWSMRIILLLLAAVYAPLVEEFFFRGALQGYLRSRWCFVGSALLTGVIFAALHPQGLWGIPALASISFALSLLREWRGSIVASMVAHALNNAVITGLLLLAL
jgi:membrane protease YdiL (CAAX protease family)